MPYNIFAINPGSTSTKVALYSDQHLIFTETVSHDNKILDQFETLAQQTDYRKEYCLKTLNDYGYSINDLEAVVGRGGFLPPSAAGAYEVDDKMIEILTKGDYGIHASNLGGIIARSIADEVNIPSFIYDSVTSNELSEIASVTGLADYTRVSVCHVLNSKATSRKYAETIDKNYEDINVIVAHMGGGITISAHSGGKIIDCVADDSGPFSPERLGSIPSIAMVKLCFSGKYTQDELIKIVRGMGGIKAHLGTSDIRDVEKMIEEGNEKAQLIYDAQIYQLAKGISSMLPVFGKKADAVILTGGMAYSKKFTSQLMSYLNHLVRVVIIPGENEMEALAFGALRVLRGEEDVHHI